MSAVVASPVITKLENQSSADHHNNPNTLDHQWAATWTALLNIRDAREQTPFVSLFQAYNDAVMIAEHRSAEILNIQSQLSLLRAELSDTTQQLAEARQNGNPDTLARLANLDQEVKQLKEEQTDLYKTNAGSAQRVLNLMDASHVDKELIKSMTERVDQLLNLNRVLTTKLSDNQDLIKEKDHVIQILRDELSAHQLELIQREEQLNVKTKRVAELEADNKTLLERWIMLKQKEASHMNEANEIMEAQVKFMPKLATILFCSFNRRIVRLKLVTVYYFDQLRALKNKVSTKRKESFLGFPLFLLPSDTVLDKPEKIYPETSALQCVVPTTGVRKMTAHDGEISCIAISRDGGLLATGGNDRKLILFNGNTCSQKAIIDTAGQSITCVAFNGSGDSVLSTSIDHSIKVWNTLTFRSKITFTGHSGKVCAARFTNSNRIVSGSHDRSIKIWDLVKGYSIRTLFTLSSCNDLALLDSEGQIIISGHLDNNVRIWDARTGNNIREITGIHSGQVTSVEVSPNQHQFLTTSRDHTLQLLDVRTYTPIATYADGYYRVGMNWARSCFSPDGSFISSGSADGTVFFWDIASKKMVQSNKEHKSAVCGVVWHPQGGSAVYSASDKDKCVVQWGTLN
ncbi:hypothetical protein QVD99_005457 [Batrachochytrium dendrobatidis]|nr:hypothetical protein QVD99_005457 [Batrachochytrium dendrobatidis]